MHGSSFNHRLNPVPVLVSDTSVLIDLERGSFLQPAFRLPFEFVVPDPCPFDFLPEGCHPGNGNGIAGSRCTGPIPCQACERM